MYYSIDKMNRAGFKWTVNETLSLQREFELLGMTIDEIALKHKRTPNAIMYKLDQEGFADYNVLYSNYHDLNSRIPAKRSSKNASGLTLKYDYDTEIDDSDLDDGDDEDYVDNEDEDDEDEDDDDDSYRQAEMDVLSQRVYNLETSVYEIKILLNEIMSKQSNTSKQSLSKQMV
jgi:hypothetical protein